MSAEQKLSSFRARIAAASAAPSVISQGSSPSVVSQRRASATDFLTRQQQRPSKLAQTTDRSPKKNRASYHQDMGLDTTDTVSTAHSAIWDEMPEMKTLVNKVDYGRSFPSPAGATSNGSQERPRTGTTTITTISSSPKLSMGLKPGEKRLSQDINNIHPLLHQSLARCKPVVSPTLYRSLEKAAADALEMASWAKTTGVNGSIYSSASAINGVSGDRQLRRKADNICRNLTDLCITLAEAHGSITSPTQDTSHQSRLVSPSTATSRRASRDYSASLYPSQQSETLPRSYRHASVEPERPSPATSRALERVEARRVSYLSTGTPSGSPREANAPAPLLPASARPTHLGVPDSSPITPSTSLLRSGTSLLRTRRPVADYDDEDAHSVRPISRATTEIGAGFRKRNDRQTLNRQLEQLSTSQSSISAAQNANILRRVTGGALLQSPTTPSSAGIPSRTSSRFLYEHLSAEGASQDEEERRAKRRSFSLYPGSSSASVIGGSSRGFGVSRTSSLAQKRASLTAGGGE
jgi:hypothetical protein